MLKELFETVFPNHDFMWSLSGEKAKGFCPFHSDHHSKSLSIYLGATGKERWFCFGEGIGGSAVDVVRNSGIEGTNTFDGANFWLTQNGFQQESEQQVKDRLRNTALYKFYQWTNELLRNSDQAIQARMYLEGRHIDTRLLEDSALGYYPDPLAVEEWLHKNDLYDELSSYVLPKDRKSDRMSNGSFIFFYKHSYYEFARLKLRNTAKQALLSADNKNKAIILLGGSSKKEAQGYFSFNMTPVLSNDAILVEGEFDAAALSTLVYNGSDGEAVFPIYCFSGGLGLKQGVTTIENMGKENIYIFPDNDTPGLEYVKKVTEVHPNTFVIMPSDYKSGDDPASWAADHDLDDLNEAMENRIPAFIWMGREYAQKAAREPQEGQVRIKKEVVQYARTIAPTDREAFLSEYCNESGISMESMLEEIQETSSSKYKRILNGASFGIYMKTYTPKGMVEWEPISNIIVTVERDVSIDSGDNDDPELALVLKLTMLSKEAKITIKADEFLDDKKFMLAIVGALGTKVWVKPRHVPFLREATILISNELYPDRKIDYIYQHTGWRDDGRFYMPNCYIDGEGWHELAEVKVELPANPAYMRNYRLEDPPADLSHAKSIIRDELLQVFGYNVTLPYLLHIFSTPLRHFIPIAKPNALWVQGLTGSFKTSYTGVMASFFGDFRTCDFDTWRSTPNALEKNGYYTKDVPYVIDDYKGIDIAPKALTAVIQNYGDRHGRARMNVDLSARKTWHIRGNLISTAEDVPTGEASVISRILLLKITGVGDTHHLTKAQEFAHELPAVMSKFIQFLINKNIRPRELEKLLSERRLRFNAVHGRISESLALMTICWDFVEEFFDWQDLRPEVDKALLSILDLMNTYTREEQAGYIFATGVENLLATELYYLEGYKGARSTPHVDTAISLGWITDDEVLLRGDQCLEAVNKHLKNIDGPSGGIKYTRNTIYAQLIQAGVAKPNRKGESTHSKRIGDVNARVLVLKRGVVEHCEEPTDSPEPKKTIFRMCPKNPNNQE